jgi:hypothetical protein
MHGNDVLARSSSIASLPGHGNKARAESLIETLRQGYVAAVGGGRVRHRRGVGGARDLGLDVPVRRHRRRTRRPHRLHRPPATNWLVNQPVGDEFPPSPETLVGTSLYFAAFRAFALFLQFNFVPRIVFLQFGALTRAAH